MVTVKVKISEYDKMVKMGIVDPKTEVMYYKTKRYRYISTMTYNKYMNALR